MNMHESLSIWTLIESISRIKIEIIQQEHDKGKIVLRTIWLKPDFSGPFIKKHLNSLFYITNFNCTLIPS